MEPTTKTMITVENTVNAPAEKVWEYWNQPVHVTKWNQASPEWHSPRGENDLRVGGSFSYRMEAKDGSFGFDFGGVYDEVRLHEYIAYTMGDGRKVAVTFSPAAGGTRVVESFEAENMNSIEMQQAGWQAILDSFKKYTEEN
ncbi:MAG: SRPBCC family protein [Chitinophagaceae bacterium]|nr:SRPBCC family protein [Chitinophagaceae bacterium]